MYVLEINYNNSTIELMKSSHWEKVYYYILQNKKDLMTTLKALPDSKLYVVYLESGAWEVELE